MMNNDKDKDKESSALASTSTSANSAEFETEEQRAAYAVWFKHGGNYAAACRESGVEYGTMYRWAGKWSWDARAKKASARASAQMEDVLARDRKERLSAQLKAGTLLRIKGVKALLSDDLEIDARSAIAMVKGGIEIERAVDGLPSHLADIANADAATLRALASQLQEQKRAFGSGSEWDDGDSDGDDELRGRVIEAESSTVGVTAE